MNPLERIYELSTELNEVTEKISVCLYHTEIYLQELDLNRPASILISHGEVKFDIYNNLYRIFVAYKGKDVLWNQCPRATRIEIFENLPYLLARLGVKT